MSFQWTDHPPSPKPTPKDPKPQTIIGKATFVARPMPFHQSHLSKKAHQEHRLNKTQQQNITFRCPQTLRTPTLVQEQQSTPPSLCSPTREAPPFFGVYRAPKKDWHTPTGETDKTQLYHRRGAIHLEKSKPNPSIGPTEDSEQPTQQLET